MMIRVEIDLEEEIANLGDEEFAELFEWMLMLNERRIAARFQQPAPLKYDPERAYRALQKLRKHEVEDAKWELEGAF